MSSEILLVASDILRNPVKVRAYEHLKSGLLDRYGIRTDEKIHQLVELTLVDLKPTELLYQMQASTSNTTITQVHKILWLDRLYHPKSSVSFAILVKIWRNSLRNLITVYGMPALRSRLSYLKKSSGFFN